MGILSSKPTITRKELEGVLDCMISDRLTGGETLRRFESLLTGLTGIKYTLALSSPTAAYLAAFRSMEIKAGDEIIMPSFFYGAPLNAALTLGAEPKLLDCNEASIFPSIEDILASISEKTGAVVLGDLFGYPMPREELQKIEPPLVMDVSSTLDPEEEMNLPEAAFLVASFASDMLLTTGYGSMIQTSNSRHYSSIRDLRWSENRPNLDSIMTDLQAAMGISQLSRLKAFVKRRREIAKIYSDSLKTTEHKTPFVFSDTFTYQAFPIHFDATTERIERYWKKNGVEVLPLLAHPAHQRLGFKGMDYPHSDRLSRKLYGIPIYPTLTKKEIEKISRLLASFL